MVAVSRPIRPYSPRIVCTPGVVETEWKWGDLVCWGSVGQNGRIESLCYELCWHGRIQISLSSIGASSWHDDHKPELRSFWMFSITKPPFEYNVAQIMHGFMVHFPSKKMPLGSTIGWDFSHIISDFSHLGSLERRILSPRSTSVSIQSCKLMIEKATYIVMICQYETKRNSNMCFVGLSVFLVHFRVFKWIVKEHNHRFQYEALARSWTQDFSDHQDDVTISRLKRKQLKYCTSSSKRWN